MRRSFVLLAFTCSMCFAAPMPLRASEPLKADIGADLVSSYLWRGTKMDGLSIQPDLGLEWGGLSFNVWGSVGFTGDYSEMDLTLAYSAGGLNVGLTDYWCVHGSPKYYDFSVETPHVLEANIGYDFGFLSVNWYSNVIGAIGTNADGRKAYSSYIELAAPFSLGGLEWSAAVGATPWANDFYGSEGFSVINCSLTATKTLELGSFSIPLSATLMTNPMTGGMFMAVAASF